MAVLWRYFIKESLGSWQGNKLLAVLERWPSYRVAVLRGSTVLHYCIYLNTIGTAVFALVFRQISTTLLIQHLYQFSE